MTAFECDELVGIHASDAHAPRERASRYTERHPPIFVGQHVDIHSALQCAFDGAAARVGGVAP